MCSVDYRYKKIITCEFEVRFHRIETISERGRFDRVMTLLAGLFAEALDDVYEIDAAEKLKINSRRRHNLCK